MMLPEPTAPRAWATASPRAGSDRGRAKCPLSRPRAWAASRSSRSGGDVIVDVLVLAEHAAHAVLDEGGELERERHVIRAHGRHGHGVQVAVAVLVLEAFAVQRGAAGRRAEHEAARHRIARGPQVVARALEAEHRIEDVKRDHRLAVHRVGGGRRDERSHRARLGDALFEDLSVFRLLVIKELALIDRLVELPDGGVDCRPGRTGPPCRTCVLRPGRSGRCACRCPCRG